MVADREPETFEPMRGSAGASLSTAGETPARKFEEAGSAVSGRPSPSVSILTPCLYRGRLTYAQTELLPGPRSMRRVTSRRPLLSPLTGVKTALTLRASGAV